MATLLHEEHERKCPEDGSVLLFEHSYNTERRGLLRYYKCKKCGERFVTINDGELNTPAPNR